MAVGDGYTPQLNPASGDQTSFSGMSSDWGRPLTDSLGSVDDAVHAFKDKQRDQEATQAGVQFAQDTANLDNAAIALRQQSGPGGAGHTDAVNQMIDNASSAAISNISDHKIRLGFQQRYAELKQQLGTREYGWQAGQYVENLANNFKDQARIGNDHLASTGDYGALQTQLAGLKTTAGSLAVNPDLAHQLYKETANQAVMAYAGAAVRLNPYALVGNADTGQKGQLDDPNFVSNFSNPDAIDQIRHQAEVQINHNEAVKQQALNQQKAAFSAKYELFNYEVHDLHSFKTPQEFQDLEDSAKALGMPLDGVKLANLRDVNDINQHYQGLGPDVWQADLLAQAKKVHDAGDNATDYDRMHLKNLQELAPKAIEQFKANAQLYSQSGPMPAPSIDWSEQDPNKLATAGANLRAWANHFAAANHITDPASIILNPADKTQFKEDLTGQPPQQIQAITRLQSAFGSQTTAAIVEHLVPGNKMLKFEAALSPRGIQLLQRGQAALDSKMLTLGAPEGDPNHQADRQAVNDGIAWWMDAVPKDMQPGFYEVAPKIAAGVATENGNRSPSGDELKGLMSNVVQRVGGLTGANGQYTGGFDTINGSKVWLPSDVGRQEFLHRTVTAAPADWIKAGNGAPYYVPPHGKPTPLNPVQMQQLTKYRIVPVNGQGGTGVYALQDPHTGGRLKQKDGVSDWTFNIRNLR